MQAQGTALLFQQINKCSYLKKSHVDNYLIAPMIKQISFLLMPISIKTENNNMAVCANGGKLLWLCGNKLKPLSQYFMSSNDLILKLHNWLICLILVISWYNWLKSACRHTARNVLWSRGRWNSSSAMTSSNFLIRNILISIFEAKLREFFDTRKVSRVFFVRPYNLHWWYTGYDTTSQCRLCLFGPNVWH